MKIIKTKKYIKAQSDYDNRWDPDEELREQELSASPVGKANEKREREADKIVNKKVVDVLARYIADGYLAYAEYASKPEARFDKYWPDYYDNDHDIKESETILLKNVPIDLAEKLITQGSSEQFFSDGYEAANAATPYIEKQQSYDQEISEQFPDTPMGLEEDNPVEGIDF